MPSGVLEGDVALSQHVVRFDARVPDARVYSTTATGVGAEPGMAYPPDLQHHGHTYYDRASPRVLGEEFFLHDLDNMPRTARVVRIYGDGLVIAWIEGDRPELLDEFLDQLDDAVTHVRELALPLMQDVFVPRLPVTSTGSGQYMMRGGGTIAAWVVIMVFG